MRRRHTDERCGLCEAAPCRPCRGVLPGFWHFQPPEFTPELPSGARAKSSGRLGTPERNHGCAHCSGTGRVYSMTYGSLACGRCWGSGELTARGGAPRDYFTNTDLRHQVSAARAAGRIGQRGATDLFVLGMIAVAVTLAGLVVAAVIQDSEGKERCEARGGYWYHAYKSPGVCLSKGTVLP